MQKKEQLNRSSCLNLSWHNPFKIRGMSNVCGDTHGESSYTSG